MNKSEDTSRDHMSSVSLMNDYENSGEAYSNAAQSSVVILRIIRAKLTGTPEIFTKDTDTAQLILLLSVHLIYVMSKCKESGLTKPWEPRDEVLQVTIPPKVRMRINSAVPPVRVFVAHKSNLSFYICHWCSLLHQWSFVI
ncbi:hypothetical protein CDAR_481921 [Caerostris darwini]|uniref:Uncharacterized protein n=1 Tax=Caerostris darwini TaxID=1538125 RepID=A0AAV4QU64_9ARAC|nr:hypothetical protein CDAR_481921 [Caerostris darwini]